MATGICGLVNISGPTFGDAPARSTGYYFVAAGQRLGANFSRALNEEKNKPQQEAQSTCEQTEFSLT
jgi:hypothetical protein